MLAQLIIGRRDDLGDLVALDLNHLLGFLAEVFGCMLGAMAEGFYYFYQLVMEALIK